MKIIKDNVAYVQKIDLEFLKYKIYSLPPSISQKIYENSEIIVDDYNLYDFFKFEDIEDIEFFRNTEWIIDYESVRNLTIEEIHEIGKKLVEKREKITKKLYNMTPNDNDYQDTSLQYKLIHHQINSLDDICDFKAGLLKMRLPDEGNIFLKLLRNIFPKRKN